MDLMTEAIAKTTEGEHVRKTHEDPNHMKIALTRIVWTHQDIFPDLSVGCIHCDNEAEFIMHARNMNLPVCLACASKPHEVVAGTLER